MLNSWFNFTLDWITQRINGVKLSWFLDVSFIQQIWSNLLLVPNSHILYWVTYMGATSLFGKWKKKKKHSPLNSSIVLNHGKLCLDLCNKQVGNKCVSKFPHRIRMIRERVIGGSTLSLGWSLDHPSFKKKVIIYNFKTFMIFYS